MAAKKKVFFGSLFSFTSTGANDFIEEFRGRFGEHDGPSFISYDQNNKLFSCEVDLHDNTQIVPMFNAQINTYITMRDRDANEPLEHEILVPIEGTVYKDERFHQTIREQHAKLLSDIEDSSDEDDTLTKDKTITYWKPQCGDISIMTADIALEIADSTGCHLIPDTVAKRVKLTQGNTLLALEKLQRLEKLMTYCSPHQSESTSRSNNNIILLQSGPGSTIKFVRPNSPHCGFDRIIVGSPQYFLLHKILLGEVRVWENSLRAAPRNLDLNEVSLTLTQGTSRLFNAVALPVFGDIRNAEARAPSIENSQASGSVQRPASPSKFLGQKDAEKIEEWRGQVDPKAAPTLPPPEPVPDEGKGQGMSRRRMIVDSDSDDEEDEDEDKDEDEDEEINEDKDPEGTRDSNQEAGEDGNQEVIGQSPTAQETDNEVNLPPQPHLGQVQTDVSTHVESSAADTDVSSRKPLSTSAVNSLRQFQSEVVVKSKTRQPLHKPQAKTNNIFDLIADVDDVDSEVSSLEKSEELPTAARDVKQKQNVKFAEPRSFYDNLPSPRQSQGPIPYTPDYPKYDVQKNTSANRSNQDSGQYESSSWDKRNNKTTGPASVASQSKTRPESAQLERSREPRYDRSSQPSRTKQATVPYRQRQQLLIDVSADDEIRSDQVSPPPGFEYQAGSLITPISPLMISPTKTPTRYISDEQFVQQGTSTVQSSQLWGGQAADDSYKPQFTVPKRNVNYMRDQAAARIKAQWDKEAGKGSASNARSARHTQSVNRIQQDDEHSTRKYHNTMSQKMAKPGKGQKKGGKEETKAEREARIAKVKAEAYGDTSTAKNPANTSKVIPRGPRLDSVANMSANKRQLIKNNQAMAELHKDTLQHVASDDAAVKVADALKPILEATRAYKGVIQVEAQLGQALVLKNNRFDETRLYTPKEWEELLNNSNNGPDGTGATFTNILTLNGHDIDRMLEIKAEKGNSKIWSKNQPGLISTVFEFTCQDHSGVEFLLNLDQDGKHTLMKLPATIGKVALHAPSQIWDACIVICGNMRVLRPSEELLTGVEQFLENLYIPESRRATVYFRLPANNAFTVKAIIMKRTSIHDCQLLEREEIQLRIIESKVLAHFSNSTDSKLFRSYESDYPIMVQEDRINYKVAIVNKSVEQAYINNPEIEIGELADINTPDGKIMNLNQAKALVDITAHMLTKIDWAGASNIGTLRRISDNAADARASIINTLPPTLNHNIPIPMGKNATTVAAPTVHPSHQSRISPKKGSSGSGGAGATNANNYETASYAIPGIRANTSAQMYRDLETGDMYYLGQGGARIPIVRDQHENMRFDSSGPVVPGDSASQIGDSRKKPSAPAGNKSKSMVWDDKPPGFW